MAVPIVARGGFLVDNGTSLPIDAFGRVRTSNPSTLLQLLSSQLGSIPAAVDSPSAAQGFAGTATITGNSATSTINMTTASNGDAAVRQSARYVPYQPGKSRLIYLSGCRDAASGGNGSDVVTRIGVFDGDITGLCDASFNDGHFFQYTNGTLSVVERSSVSGSVVDTAISQSNWNGDKMDGTGPSGFTVDVTKMQLFWIDMEWLGVGNVRFGLVVNETLVVCHTINHANTLTNTMYTRTALLPVRYEIQATGSGSPDGEITVGCGTVISEGGYIPIGRNFTFPYPSVLSYVVDAGGTAPRIYLRLGKKAGSGVSSTTDVRTLIRLRSLNLSTADKTDTFYWTLYYVYEGADTSTWTNVDANGSIARYSSTPTPTTLPVSGNYVAMLSGILVDSTTSVVNADAVQGGEDIPPLGSTLDGLSHYYALAIYKPATGSDTVYVTMNWTSIQQ